MQGSDRACEAQAQAVWQLPRLDSVNGSGRKEPEPAVITVERFVSFETGGLFRLVLFIRHVSDRNSYFES